MYLKVHFSAHKKQNLDMSVILHFLYFLGGGMRDITTKRQKRTNPNSPILVQRYNSRPPPIWPLSTYGTVYKCQI